ncbi:MAG: hypothetical protein ACFFD4_19910 [Candidatus Odinarchaeota archaeon]
MSRVIKSAQKFKKRSGLHSRDEHFVQLATVEMLLQDYDISAKAKEVFHFILKKGGLVTKTLIENGLALKRSNLNLYLSELEGIDLITVFSASNRKYQRIRSRKHSKVILIKQVPSDLFRRESFTEKLKIMEELENYDHWFIPLDSGDKELPEQFESSLYLQKWSPDLSASAEKIEKALQELDFSKEEAAILAYTFSLRTASLSTIKQAIKSSMKDVASSDFEINFNEALRFLEKSRYITRYGKKSAAGVILISSFGQIARERLQQLLRSEDLLDLSINSLLNEYFGNFQRKMVQYISKDTFTVVSDMLLRTESLCVILHQLSWLDDITSSLIQLSVQNRLKNVNFCVRDPSMVQSVLKSFANAYRGKLDREELSTEMLIQAIDDKKESDQFKVLKFLNFYRIDAKDFGLENTLIFDEKEVILLHDDPETQSGTYTVFFKTTEKEYQKYLNAKQNPLEWH